MAGALEDVADAGMGLGTMVLYAIMAFGVGVIVYGATNNLAIGMGDAVMNRVQKRA